MPLKSINHTFNAEYSLIKCLYVKVVQKVLTLAQKEEL